MTENDKIELLNTLNKASEALQHVETEEISDNYDVIEYFKLKSALHEIIQLSVKRAEYNDCKVIWEGYKAVKIVEKEGKEWN